MTKAGDRIRLIETRDIFTKLKPGDIGTVKDVIYLPESIDGQMQLWVKCDSGSNLALIDTIDQWEEVE